MMLPVLAISIGDPGGIGPEVALKAFADGALLDICVPVLFGPAGVVTEQARRFIPNIAVRRVTDSSDIELGSLNLVSTSDETGFPVGVPSAAGGRASLDAIKAATQWCLRGVADAMVTAPISKESIGLAGSPYKGHTEFIRDLSESGDVLMVLASETMRVGLVTIHVPLKEVPALLTVERIERTIGMAHAALVRDFGIPNPRLAVLGLNPHAGDGGYLGSEEQERIAPVVTSLQTNGLQLEGPFPADAFFSAYGSQAYDMIIAMYHDQGLIPLKMSANGKAVNITCGLPIIRTSPDHGTAFNIAGQDKADPGSFSAALRMALEIAENRKSITKEPQDD